VVACVIDEVTLANMQLFRYRFSKLNVSIFGTPTNPAVGFDRFRSKNYYPGSTPSSSCSKWFRFFQSLSIE
jgi:hypothetical protein